jgi:3-oxoacyl-[acyl-carrier-protein] synthase II
VVASSNLSNVGTVRSVMASVAAGGKREVSAMEAPNTSSNVVASTVGLWFRWGGPNLMICSGATAGLDAVATGMLLLRARRADRVVVVGVEAGDEVARELHAGGSARGRDRGTPLREGAACLILARPDRATDRVPLLGPVLSSCEVSVGPDMQTPAAVVGQVAHRGTRVVDLTALVGDCYGAAGVVQVAVAAALAPAAGGPVAIVCGDDIDGWRATWLHPGAVRGGA